MRFNSIRPRRVLEIKDERIEPLATGMSEMHDTTRLMAVILLFDRSLNLLYCTLLKIKSLIITDMDSYCIFCNRIIIKKDTCMEFAEYNGG